MKLILLLISATAIIVGLLNNNQPIIVVGAIFFISIQTGTLVKIYHSAKYYKNNTGQSALSNKDNFVDIFSKWLGGIIAIFGLIIMIVDSDDKYGLFLAGAIIWIGTVTIYFLGGIIIQHITGIPLKFGYDGWYIYRRRH